MGRCFVSEQGQSLYCIIYIYIYNIINKYSLKTLLLYFGLNVDLLVWRNWVKHGCMGGELVVRYEALPLLILMPFSDWTYAFHSCLTLDLFVLYGFFKRAKFEFKRICTECQILSFRLFRVSIRKLNQQIKSLWITFCCLLSPRICLIVASSQFICMGLRTKKQKVFNIFGAERFNNFKGLRTGKVEQ